MITNARRHPYISQEVKGCVWYCNPYCFYTCRYTSKKCCVTVTHSIIGIGGGDREVARPANILLSSSWLQRER